MADKQSKVNPNKNWFSQHKIVTGLLALLVIIILGVSLGGKKNTPTSEATNNTANTTPASKSQSTKAASTSSSKPAARQVKGTATTLGAGTFTVGKDIAVGLYDVTPGAGQSGNFIVTGSDGTSTYNEVLGDPSQGDVSKVRAALTSGDSVQISGMSGVTFTPVTTPYVTSHATTTLYAGTFVVGQDIGSGRYVATPASGESGNFDVYDSSGNNIVNEIIGGTSADGGVPSVTTTLSNGDVIQISGIDSVTMTASD